MRQTPTDNDSLRGPRDLQHGVKEDVLSARLEEVRALLEAESIDTEALRKAARELYDLRAKWRPAGYRSLTTVTLLLLAWGHGNEAAKGDLTAFADRKRDAGEIREAIDIYELFLEDRGRILGILDAARAAKDRSAAALARHALKRLDREGTEGVEE